VLKAFDVVCSEIRVGLEPDLLPSHRGPGRVENDALTLLTLAPSSFDRTT
jgi:hypothetical protein